MKFFQSIIVAIFCMVLSSGIAQETNYVIVKVYEPINQKGEIVIAYGASKSERIPIEKLNSDHHEHNANKTVEIFNRLNKEGFALISSSSSAHGNPASILHVDTFVFGRKD